MPARGYRASHCKRGHEFTPENTLTAKGRNGQPKRQCRQCLVDATRRRRGTARTGLSQSLAMAEERRLQADTGTKRCARCERRKPLADFKRHSKTHDGLYPACRECCANRWRELDSPERRAREAAKVRDASHGLRVGQYDSLLQEQGGGCAICGQQCTSGRSLAVDHDHATGAIRGLLCGTCNRAIGMMQDSPEILRAAAQYLENHAHSIVQRG